MKNLLITLLLAAPILFSSCDILLSAISYSMEQAANRPDLNYAWETTYSGVRVSGTLRNDGANTVSNTSIKVNITAENGETDYGWIEIDETLSSGSCTSFCETVYTNTDNISDVHCRVSSYH